MYFKKIYTAGSYSLSILYILVYICQSQSPNSSQCPPAFPPQKISYISFFFKKNYLFLAVLGLRCCARAFSSCGEQGLLFVAVSGLLTAVASLVVEHRLKAHRIQQFQHAGSVVVARGLQSAGSVVVVHGLSCSAACGIFPDQGSNLCPLHWQVDS